MIVFETKIKLPDYSYIPANIQLDDKIFNSYGEAEKHIDKQCDILCNWMLEDPSCKSKPIFNIFITYYPNQEKTILIKLNDPDNNCCTFTIKRKEKL